MYNGLPLSNNEDSFDSIVLQHVTTDSPRAFLAYGPECPKPIDPEGCQSEDPPEPSPNHEDIHNPRFGQKIADEYADLGIGDRIRLVDGMENANITNIYYYFNESLSLPRAGTSAPPTTTTVPTCEDNDDEIITLAESVGVTVSGCSDPRVSFTSFGSKLPSLPTWLP